MKGEAKLRKAHAKALWEEYAPDENMGSDLDAVSAGRYACLVRRDSESWLVACEGGRELAETLLAYSTGGDGEGEWVETVFDLLTGEPQRITWQEAHVLTIEVAGKRHVVASSHEGAMFA